MNHHPVRSADPKPASPTRRQLAKQRTRLKLLEVARELFTDRGYEAATIRDIAAAANLSTGAVFASFTDKADLFSEVISADYEQVLALMQRAPDHGGPVQARLLGLLTLAYEEHMDRLRLVQSVMSFSWTRDLHAGDSAAPGATLVLDYLAEVLQQGVDRGELPAQLDVALTSEMLWDCYLANYRRVIFDGWGRDALRKRLSDQLGVLLCVHRQAA